MIVEPKDLYTYSIALRNSGVTPENIGLLEQKFLPLIFGKEGARALVRYVAEHKSEQPGAPAAFTGNFGGEAPPAAPRYDFGEADELINGDGLLYAGLRALLSVVICLDLLSQNRMQVARQNVAKQPLAARSTTRREEADVVQSLSYTARSQVCALRDYLTQPGKNPLGLNVRDVIQPSRYRTNTSGRMPMNDPYFNLFLG